MFTKTLTEQGTEEQQKLFTERAARYEIIGCYAQTELGHGSNVQGLETTADYDVGAQEWVINSPSLTASKWWIGGLGRTADHAVVMAQLRSNGKSYGPHPFVVPIRDLETREPLPGRTIGDIGPKIGYQVTDNGMLSVHLPSRGRAQNADDRSGCWTRSASRTITSLPGSPRSTGRRASTTSPSTRGSPTGR